MGIFDVFKKQFIDVLEWNETEDGVLQYRYPMQDNEIQNGGQLTVRDSQLAMFVNEGKIADVFEPGRYTLNTQTLPVLTALNNWDKLFKSPFKSDIFFFSTREQLDQKWGTTTPITVRDKEFGALRIRAYGTYTYRVQNPKVFFQKISGTREKYTVRELEGQIRSAALTRLATFLAASEVGFIDMAASQTKFSDTLKAALLETFSSYGLELTTFFVQSISLPDELQGALDKMASMRMLGDLRKYAQFQAADSISVAAANPGGVAAAGAGLGAGVAIGQSMASAFGAPSGGAGASEEDPLKMIDRLHELMKKGVLSKEEFEAKKAELLKKIG